MSDLLGFLPPFSIETLTSFAWRVFDSILVGAVVTWLLSLGRAHDRRLAREQIAEQLCRVFGMRLYHSRKHGTPSLEELPPSSLQGWSSLERLQWSLDLHRSELRPRELRLMQALMEDLLRIRANQFTAELHLLDEYLPGAARWFLPPPLREKFLEDAKLVGLPRLTDGLA
jgi:hypothetical protein